MIVKLLHNPTEEELDRIVDICVRAFDGSVTVKCFLGGDWSLHAEYVRARTRAVALEGELYVGVIESSGKIVSTASWFPPGGVLFGTEAQRALGFDEFMSKMNPESRKWQEEVLSKIFTEQAEPLWEKREFPKRWWCCNLATDPDYQQNGFATELMRVLADKADKHGDLILGLIALTDETIRFYQGIGYRERGNVPVNASTGYFGMHVMSRDRSEKSYR